MDVNQKITIIFPPGDQLTSLFLQKETNTKIHDLLTRLCTLRAIDFDLKKFRILNDVGEDVDLSKTVGESGLVFIDIVDKKDAKKTEKEKKEKCPVSRGLPQGMKLEVGKCCNVPLEEQLFEDEKKALSEFKSQNTELCMNFSDEFVLSCLFARKMDAARALELLQNSLKWRKENNFMNLPKFSDIPPEYFQFTFHIPGSRDKYGRCIKYIKVDLLRPNVEPFTIHNIKKFYAWSNYVGVFAEGIDAHRNGVHGVIDLSNYGWQNFDLDFHKQIGPMWANTFPLLVRRMSMINPPRIMNAIVKITKSFLKEKVAQRLIVCNSDKALLKLVDGDQLWKGRGGNLEWGVDQWRELLGEWSEKNEERLSAPGRE